VGGTPFLSDCNILAFFGCSSVCPTGSTCVAECGPSGNAGAEAFVDSNCSGTGTWLAGNQCTATLQASYGRCCCN
jgi:hypothetical protein